MRLFVGLPVPPSPAYDAVSLDLARRQLGARLTEPEARHVTLRFLGDMAEPDGVIAALEAACRGRPALPCVIEGVGTFPNRGFPPHKQARVAWAGVRCPGIEGLAQAVEQATARFGEPPERRPFVAHVTLARLARPADLREFVTTHTNTSFGAGRFDRVVLYQSVHTPRGTQYREVHAVALGRPDAPRA